MKYLTALVLMFIMPLSYIKTVAGYDLARILPKSITAKAPLKWATGKVLKHTPKMSLQ